jgi:hypothetical protein
MILLEHDTTQICFLKTFVKMSPRVEMISNWSTLDDMVCVSVKAASVPKSELHLLEKVINRIWHLNIMEDDGVRRLVHLQMMIVEKSD